MALSISASSSTSLVPAITDSCEGCFAGGAYDIISGRDPTTQLTPYIVYTAYSVTSATLIDGSCTTEHGPPISLSSHYSVTVPSSVNPSSYLPSANQQFAAFLGFGGCSGGVGSVLPTLYISEGDVSSLPYASVNVTISSVTPTISISSGTTRSPATSTTSVSSTVGAGSAKAAPTSTSSAVITSSNKLNTASRISIGVIIPIACIALAAAAAFMLIRYRNKRRRAVLNKKNGDDAAKKTDSSPPYLQNKAELEDEERRKHELEAKSVRYEIGAEGVIHEAPTGGHFGNSKAQNQQELRGEEFSKELATNNAKNAGRGQ